MHILLYRQRAMSRPSMRFNHIQGARGQNLDHVCNRKAIRLSKLQYICPKMHLW